MLSTERNALSTKIQAKATKNNESSYGQQSERPTTGSPGREVPIAIPLQNGGFQFLNKELEQILLRSGVKNKPLVVISVAGAFRTGKSFLLNFLIRYLRNQGGGDWMGDADSRLEGFSWRGGCDRHTAGILIWSEVFLVTRPRGDQVAVVLMDTQGTFDCQTSFKDVTTIFALGALTSSVMVYNISGNIREDDLQHLQYFIEYGRMAQRQRSNEKPFQKLMILVRDWSFVKSYKYGAEGGAAFVKERLKTSAEKPEQKTLRELLASSFGNIDCFLMPYPGKEVATGESDEGYLPRMDDTFKHYLQDFVASLLAEDKLVTKRINGQEISCGDWVTYFSTYGENLRRGHLPEPKSILEMTAAANNETALNKAIKRYEEGMEEECGASKPFKNTWDLKNLHKAQKKAALHLFKSQPKMGGNDFSKSYEKKLRKEIKRMKQRFYEYNKTKSCYDTPVVLSIPMVLSVGAAVAATVVGGPIGAAATITALVIGGTTAGTLTAWRVSQVTGKIPAFRRKLDNAVDYVCTRIRFWKKTPEKVSSDAQVDSHSPQNDTGEAFEMVEMPLPVQIIRAKEGQSLEVDDEVLGRILLANDVKDKPVVVISVAGAAGTGKSFLLEVFLQYMRSGCRIDWIDHSSVPLGGDPWREACEPETTGILIWEEVFLVTRSDGQQVAVLFMYTHGDFNATQSTVEDSAKLFALSTMTSSVQVYNLSKTITEEDIKHLQFLTDYEMLTQQDRSDVPLQELLFVVRDWSEQQCAEYGAEGGRGFHQTRLLISDGQSRDLQQLRRIIRSSFTTIRCFLMPHPGSKVAKTSSSDSPSSDIEGNFKEQLHQLVSALLEPDKLLVKKINGKEVSCQELMTYFQAYVNAFKEHRLQESDSTQKATPELKILIAVATSNYNIAMANLCGSDQPYIGPTVLESHHKRQREIARKWLCDRLKMPEEEACQRCLDELAEAIDQAFEKFATLNKTAMTMVMARTPATLFVTVLVFYFLSGTFTFIGADSFANFCNLVMGLSSIGLLLWSYVCLTGTMADAGALIDSIATFIWESVLMMWILSKHLIEARTQSMPNRTATSRGRWTRQNHRMKKNGAVNAKNSHRNSLS